MIEDYVKGYSWEGKIKGITAISFDDKADFFSGIFVLHIDRDKGKEAALEIRVGGDNYFDQIIENGQSLYNLLQDYNAKKELTIGVCVIKTYYLLPFFSYLPWITKMYSGGIRVNGKTKYGFCVSRKRQFLFYPFKANEESFYRIWQTSIDDSWQLNFNF